MILRFKKEAYLLKKYGDTSLTTHAASPRSPLRNLTHVVALAATCLTFSQSAVFAQEIDGASVSTSSGVRTVNTPRPGEQEPAPTRPTKRPASNGEEEETGPVVLNPVANPLPLTHELSVYEADVAYVPTEWRTAGRTLFPTEWIWEHGGWEWSDMTRGRRINDKTLSWNPAWGPAPAFDPEGVRMSEKRDIIGEMVPYVHFEDWLPTNDAHKCEALLAMTYAIKLHRMELLDFEKDSLSDVHAQVCQRTYTKN